MLKRFLIIFLFSVFMMGCLQAQTTNHDSLLQVLEELQQQSKDEPVPMEEEYIPEEILADTFLNIRSVSIPVDSVNAWKNKKAFAYTKNLDSLLKAHQDKEKEKKPQRNNMPSGSFIDSIFGGPVLKMLLWSMAAVFVCVILFQLAKNKGLFKSSVSRQVEEEEPVPDEDSLEHDFDKLLAQAFRAGDYRLAVRYQFLKTLQRLRDRQLIDFAADKTNSRYVHEVPPKFRNEFASLILNYEYVWYGGFELTAAQYELLQNKYVSFNNKI